jgi:hypothetical protein
MKITKKNGTIHMYDDEKVAKSILKANASIPNEKITPAMAAGMADEVFARVTKKQVITTSDVRSCVIALLDEKGFTGTAKCYREYKK